MATVLFLTTDDLSYLMALVAQAGHKVVPAYTSYDMPSLLATARPEAVIIPEGAEPLEEGDLLPYIRKSTDAAILVVGKGGQEQATLALFRGADAYLTHPVEPAIVRGRLRALLRRPMQPRQTQG